VPIHSQGAPHRPPFTFPVKSIVCVWALQIRTGRDEKAPNAHTLVPLLHEWGADAVTVRCYELVTSLVLVLAYLHVHIGFCSFMGGLVFSAILGRLIGTTFVSALRVRLLP